MIRNILSLHKSRQSVYSQSIATTLAVSSLWANITPKAVTLGLLLSLGCLNGCQPAPEASDKAASSENKPKDDNGDVALENKPSVEAQAQIDAYEAKFVTQMLNLQQRLQAEYESLQAADTAEHPETQNPTKAPNDVTDITTEGSQGDEPASLSTEVGERDLSVLKKVTLEPRAPEILDEAQLKTRYRQAFAAIYKSAPLTAQEADTFINMTTLLPDLFEEPELARQLSDKSPALARLIVQHQIWRQIEAQQVKDMQTMKIEQQQEFEALLAKFNETIEGYDEQIAKYEKMLKEFDK